MSHRLTGVVVGTVDLGEADRIVRLLTAEQGRVALLARGARSSRKRFGGLLDVGNRVRVIGKPGRGSLARLDSVELVAAVDRARTELERIALMAYGCEVLGRLAGEGVPAPKLTRLLVVWLDLLEGERRPGRASRQALEAKALTFAGLAPCLDRCALCGEAPSAPMGFLLDAGAAHAHCGPGVACSIQSLERYETLRRSPLFDTLDQESAHDPWLLSDFIQHQLGAVLKSRVMLTEFEGLPEPR